MNDDAGYLADIAQCISRIEEYTTEGRGKFSRSTLIQDAVVRNFEIIGEAAKRLTPAIIASHPEVQWRRVAGFRDILIHRYQTVDLDMVWNVVERDLPLLKAAIQAMIATLPEQ